MSSTRKTVPKFPLPSLRTTLYLFAYTRPSSFEGFLLGIVFGSGILMIPALIPGFLNYSITSDNDGLADDPIDAQTRNEDQEHFISLTTKSKSDPKFVVVFPDFQSTKSCDRGKNKPNVNCL